MVFSHMLKSSRPSSSNDQKNWQIFREKLDFKDTKFPVQIRYIHKINCISISVFSYENKEKFLFSFSKNNFKKHIDFFIDRKKGQSHYVFIKHFNIFMYIKHGIVIESIFVVVVCNL